ncbi:MAG: hypothetical protein H7335_12075 [Massilia sp.]|nr:hypothetical protein [Massilia sp.]
MPMSDQQRHQMIERAVRPLSQEHADASVVLWGSLAAELSAIIGERGFASLYSRSLNQAGARFAWLAPHPPMASPDAFRLLASNLKTRAPAEAHAVNSAMLNIFIDTLIILIGELVTNNILRSAWGDDVVNDAGTEHRT